MWDKIRRYVKEKEIINSGDRIVIGLSGGADSVCLFRFLLEISDEYGLSLYGVHVNHRIRGEEADRDEAFVRDLCKEYGVPLQVRSVDVRAYAAAHRCSVEEGGRTVRYQCFAKEAEARNCGKIAVAHHRDDLAETVLFRLIRGTGVGGLAAMRPVSGRLIRPLLCISKQEILEALGKLNQGFVIDKTNGETEYSRNYLRHRIIPELRGLNEKASEHLAALSWQAAALSDYLEPLLQEAFDACVEKTPECYLLSAGAWESRPEYVRQEILYRLLFQAAGRRRDIEAVHVALLYDLMQGREGRRISLPYQLYAQKEGAFLKIAGEKEKKPVREEKLYHTVPFSCIQEGCQYPAGERVMLRFSFVPRENANLGKNDCIKYFDYDKIKETLCIRHREDGDYFIMDQSGHRKFLKRYFIDAKIPMEKRKTQVLLADGSHILWIVGGRISEAYKITRDTVTVLRVEALYISR